MKKKFTILFVLLSVSTFLRADLDENKLKRRIHLIQESAEGWCSEEKAQAFADLVVKVKPKVCVEIGVFGGASLIPVACALKALGSGIILGIDPWDNAECVKYLDYAEDKEHIDWWSSVKLNFVYYHFLDKLILYELEDCCRILKMTSDRAVSEIGEIDILHIDGQRSQEQTLKDAKTYFPKVVSGGYIWVGDTLFYNKQKAIDFLLEKCEIETVVDNGNCVLFKKR